MSTAELKSTIHSLVNSIEDKGMLSKAYDFLAALTKKTKDSNDYDSLPDELKEAIEEGTNQLNNGQGISYKDFGKKVKNKYNF